MIPRALAIAVLLPLTLLPSRPAHAGGFTFQVAAKIVIEAESGKISPPFEVVDEAGAGGGKVVYLRDKANGKDKKPGQEFFEGSIEYKFSVEKEAAYILWLRKLWLNGCGNSIWVTMDKPVTVDDALCLGEDGTYEKLTWVELKNAKFLLKKGPHVLRVQNREDGIKLDQFALIEFEKDLPSAEQYKPVAIEASTAAAGP
ncbi:MAG: hypothetical protein HYU36_15675 [Planctomycetes bacterium]|nr:hypothetical protein [Planctomycetota bacterium]